MSNVNISFFNYFSFGGKFNQVKWEGLEISDLTAKNADFKDTHFKSSTFTNCDFRGSDFSDAQFEAVRFIECDLRGVDMSSAMGVGLQFKECVLDDIVFDHALLDREVSFISSRGVRCSFYNTDLDGARIKKSKLDGADLRKASLENVAAKNSFLRNCKIDRNTVTKASYFINCDLTDTNLTTAGDFDRNIIGGFCVVRPIGFRIAEKTISLLDFAARAMNGGHSHVANVFKDFRSKNPIEKINKSAHLYCSDIDIYRNTR